jgi:hypothetical protein
MCGYVPMRTILVWMCLLLSKARVCINHSPTVFTTEIGWNAAASIYFRMMALLRA